MTEATITDAAAEARRAYQRKWQRANADKVKEYQRRYWQKKANEAAEAAELSEGDRSQGED